MNQQGLEVNIFIPDILPQEIGAWQEDDVGFAKAFDKPARTMTRYLTPSKIGLLALICLYTEGVVPNASTISILAFLVSHLLPPDPLKIAPSIVSPGKNHAIPIEEFEEATSSHASAFPGRTIWDLFLKTIWAIDSCDALDSFFRNLSSLLGKSREEQQRERDSDTAQEANRMKLSRTSPLGAFVRRAQLEFTRLQFHDSVALWKSLIRYRLPTNHAWAKRNQIELENSVDANFIDLQVDANSLLEEVMYGDLYAKEEEKGGVSTNDVERLLDFQVGEMQSKFDSENSRGVKLSASQDWGVEYRTT